MNLAPNEVMTDNGTLPSSIQNGPGDSFGQRRDSSVPSSLVPPAKLGAAVAGIVINRPRLPQDANYTPSPGEQDDIPSWALSRDSLAPQDESARYRTSSSSSSTPITPMDQGKSNGMDLTGGHHHQFGVRLSNKDLRKAIFVTDRDRRTVSGLRVHAFTRQAFISSFAVGLLIGSIVAILLKLLKDLTLRILY